MYISIIVIKTNSGHIRYRQCNSILITYEFRFVEVLRKIASFNCVQSAQHDQEYVETEGHKNSQSGRVAG